MSEKSTDTEKPCTLNIRLTLIGAKASMQEVMDGLWENWKTRDDIKLLSFDFNNPKDSK